MLRKTFPDKTTDQWNYPTAPLVSLTLIKAYLQSRGGSTNTNKSGMNLSNLVQVREKVSSVAYPLPPDNNEFSDKVWRGVKTCQLDEVPRPMFLAHHLSHPRRVLQNMPMQHKSSENSRSQTTCLQRLAIVGPPQEPDLGSLNIEESHKTAIRETHS